MFWVLMFVITYIVTVLIYWTIVYLLDKDLYSTVGEVIDDTTWIAYIPIINIVCLIGVSITATIASILEPLWNKIRNIKV